MTELKEQLDRALTTYEPSGHAFERTMDLVQRRRRRHRVQGQSLSALVVALAVLGVFVLVFQGNGRNSQRVTPGSPVSGMAIVAARHDGSIQLLSADGEVVRTLLAPSSEVHTWGEPVTLSVSQAEDSVYIGYEALSSTGYSARIERVSLEGGSPVFVANGTNPAVSPSYNQNLWIAHLIESAAYLPS